MLIGIMIDHHKINYYISKKCFIRDLNSGFAILVRYIDWFRYFGYLLHMALIVQYLDYFV